MKSASQFHRRQFLAGSLTLGGAMIGGARPARRNEWLYIGTQGNKVHGAKFDPVHGEFAAIGPVADIERPTWAIRHPVLPILWFNQSTGNDGKSEGAVHALKTDAVTGQLEPMATVNAGGGGTTNLAYDAASRRLFAANFGSANITALSVNRSGIPGPIVSTQIVTGSGPHPRQARPHPHAVVLDPTGRWLLVPDLGADRVWVLPFDRRAGKLLPADLTDPRHAVLPPGCGPRHLALHPQGRWAYLVEELTANVRVFGWNAAIGELTSLQTISSDDASFTGTRSAAEIAVSRDGRFVYVSNRSDHSMVVFAVNAQTGGLSVIQRMASGGKLPWHFALHPGGNWIVVSNRDSSELALLRVDKKTGRLQDTGTRLPSPAPVFAIFV